MLKKWSMNNNNRTVRIFAAMPCKGKLRKRKNSRMNFFPIFSNISKKVNKMKFLEEKIYYGVTIFPALPGIVLVSSRVIIKAFHFTPKSILG